jgi:predicted membrane protein
MPQLQPSIGMHSSQNAMSMLLCYTRLQDAAGRAHELLSSLSRCLLLRALLQRTTSGRESLQVLDIMAISRFINITFMNTKITMTKMTAQLLVISSKNSSPATRSQTQPGTYARFAPFTSRSRQVRL